MLCLLPRLVAFIRSSTCITHVPPLTPSFCVSRSHLFFNFFLLSFSNECISSPRKPWCKGGQMWIYHHPNAHPDSLRLEQQIACLTFKTGTLLNNNTAMYLGIIMLLCISCKWNISALLSCFIAMLVQQTIVPELQQMCISECSGYILDWLYPLLRSHSVPNGFEPYMRHHIKIT